MTTAVPQPPASPAAPAPSRARALGQAALAVTATALLLLPLRGWLNPIDVAMVFLLPVVMIALRSTPGPAVLASVLAILAFDLLFVPPWHRLTVEDADYLLTFLVMLTVALLMSHQATRIRAQALAAEEHAREARARYELNVALATAATPDSVLGVLVDRLGALLGSPGRVVVPRMGTPGGQDPDWPDDGVFADTEVRMVAAWAWGHREAAGRGTAHGAEAAALVLPVLAGDRPAGILAFPLPEERELSPADIRLAAVLAQQGGAALLRAQIADRHEAARLEVDAEQLRTALLSSLSHDLRTPLANIEGAASSLLGNGTDLPAEVRRELAGGILDESRRMHRLVANLLDMVRVESGALTVQRTWQPLEEALGVALIRLEERLEGRRVSTDLPPVLPLVPIDELLVEQVFINLIENAIRHTPPGTPIDVSAWQDGEQVVVEVADRGPGVPDHQSEEVFRKFFQGNSEAGGPPTGGAGLGLAICRGIITAHGGRIWVEPRPGGGAAFRFTLPLEGAPPYLPPEPPE